MNEGFQFNCSLMLTCWCTYGGGVNWYIVLYWIVEPVMVEVLTWIMNCGVVLFLFPSTPMMDKYVMIWYKHEYDIIIWMLCYDMNMNVVRWLWICCYDKPDAILMNTIWLLWKITFLHVTCSMMKGYSHHWNPWAIWNMRGRIPKAFFMNKT